MFKYSIQCKLNILIKFYIYHLTDPGIERRYYDSLIENYIRNMNHFTSSTFRRPQDDLLQAGVAYGIRWG